MSVTVYQRELEKSLMEAHALVNTLATQQYIEERAYERGWRDGSASMAYVASDAWEAGYGAAEADMEALWSELAVKVRGGAEKAFPTWAQKRAMELEACKPRPGDFPGLENDPNCINKMKAGAR